MSQTGNVTISFESPNEQDLEQVHRCTQIFSANLTRCGLSVERERSQPEPKPNSEVKCDFSSLQSLFITLLDSGAVTALINSLKAIFSSAPKTLRATIKTDGRTMTLVAKDLKEAELEKLTRLLTQHLQP